MRTVAELMRDASSHDERARWRGHFEDFVAFSLALCELDGEEFVARSHYREKTERGFRKFLRSPAEIASLAGDKLLGEPRFNPDGTHRHFPLVAPAI